VRHLTGGGDLVDAVVVDDYNAVSACVVLDEGGPPAGLGCDVSQHAVGCKHA
jgi:hypothetical protein